VPTYQYACTECGDRSEVVQRFSDDPLTVCSACGGKLRKIFSPVGIVFKGSGFYRTDSRNGSSSVPAAKDGSANGSNGSNGSSSDSSSGSSESAKSGSASSDSGSAKSSGSASGDKKSSSVSSAAAG
jgi:putative FmdB family regulatory protein